MNFSATFKRPLPSLTLLVICGTATAQTTAPAPLSPADQSALDTARILERNEALWNQTLDLNEKEASLADIIAHIQTALGEGAPQVELRSPGATKSTFSLTGTPIGLSLTSLAQLSNCRVWVFDHFVVAPESALTDEERAAIERREGGEWALSSAAGGLRTKSSWSGRELRCRTVVRLVGADIKAHLAAQAAPAQAAPAQAAPAQAAPAQAAPAQAASAQAAPAQAAPAQAAPVAANTRIIVAASQEKAPFELPFGELQPASQKALQDLVNDETKRFYSQTSQESSVLSPEVMVCFDDTRGSQMTLFLRGATIKSFSPRWYADNFR